MSRILRLFDLSSYAHAGNVNKRAFLEGDIVKTQGGYREKNVPMGGISLLFNQIYAEYGKCDMLFCADRNPTIKKGMHDGYKSNRSYKNAIEIEKQVMEVVLEDCSLTVLSEDGYEADDFIYSSVQKFKNQYDHIYVHVGDSDLYLLVSNNVSIAKTHSRTKEVTMDNYQHTEVDGRCNPYNMTSFLKVLDGDHSDCIPAMDRNEARFLLNTFNTEFYRVRMGDKNFIRSTLEFIAPWAIPQFDLVYPLDTYVPDEFGAGDKERIKAWGYLMKNRLFGPTSLAREMKNNVVAEFMDAGLYIE
jgi:hypothetical protein